MTVVTQTTTDIQYQNNFTVISKRTKTKNTKSAQEREQKVRRL
jgi:hypothetical protein